MAGGAVPNEDDAAGGGAEPLDQAVQELGGMRTVTGTFMPDEAAPMSQLPPAEARGLVPGAATEVASETIGTLTSALPETSPRREVG